MCAFGFGDGGVDTVGAFVALDAHVFVAAEADLAQGEDARPCLLRCGESNAVVTVRDDRARLIPERDFREAVRLEAMIPVVVLVCMDEEVGLVAAELVERAADGDACTRVPVFVGVEGDDPVAR